GGYFEGRLRVLVNIHLFRCRRLRHARNLLWTGRAPETHPSFHSSPARFAARETIWRAKKEVSFGGLPTHRTCHLAGPPVYEPVSPLARSTAPRSRF